MTTVSKGASLFSIELGETDMITFLRRNHDGDARFYVPRELLDAYVAQRVEEIGRKLLREAMKR